MRFIILFTALLSIYSANAAAISAEDYVTSETNLIITKLSQDNSLVHDHQKMESFVINDILPQFDLSLTVQQIVGQPAWAAASEQDKDKLLGEMNIFFINLFTKTLAEYTNQTIKLEETVYNASHDKAIVKGQIYEAGNENLTMVIKVSQSEQNWKIYDIRIGGVDLVSTYQSNFKSIVSQGGVALLAEELHKKNQTVHASR
jgi:phospholipid transport system substrate-binding protein